MEGITPAMAGVVPAAVAVSLTRAVATVPVVAACLRARCRMEWIATARQRLRPVPPGRLTRPRVVHRGRVPGGAHSTGQLGRTSGSREHSAPFLTHMLRHFRLLVAKTTAPTFVATKWRVCPFCFLGRHHRSGSQAVRVASLGNSESGGLATRECSWNVWDKGNLLPMCEIAGGWLARSK